MHGNGILESVYFLMSFLHGVFLNAEIVSDLIQLVNIAFIYFVSYVFYSYFFYKV